MARHEQDREDLIAEATALVERVELQSPDIPDPLILGVRRDGCLSIYFSVDLAFHFNTRHELRRAFVAGRLIKAEQHRLVALTRERRDSQVQLWRNELTSDEEQALLDDLVKRLGSLRQSLEVQRTTVARCVPADLPALDRTRDWLALPGTITIAAAPHAR